MTHQKGSGFQDLPEDIVVSWHAMSPSQVLEKLETVEKVGLSSQEAAARIKKYGFNQLVEKPRPTFFALVIDQLKNFIVIMLIVAAVISFLLGDTIEGSAIMAIVILNAILGVVQESRAEEALAALKRMAAPEAQVLRDGNRINLPARELVPGDIVYLEAGNFIPADLRLLDAVNLRIDEAALTGESVPVQKVSVDVFTEDADLGDRKNSAFMGTTVTYGRGMGVVTSTGMTTQLGLIATMLQSVDEEQTPLQNNLDQLGKTLGYACLVVCALVFGVGIVQATGAIDVELITELFMVAVSLAIAAVPEGLAAVVTISLAMGMSEMVKRHALIRRLASVETLGSATVICSDKTGTLTQNKMTVTRIWADGKMIEVTGDGYNVTGDFYLDSKKIDLKDYPAAIDTLWAGVLNNDAEFKQVTDEEGHTGYRMIGDPTEGSILVAGAKAGMFAADENEFYPRSAEIPFDSERKRMVTVHQVASVQPEDTYIQDEGTDKEWYTVAVKGAPDVVLGLCNYYETMDNKWEPLDDAARQRILTANDNMTGEALRVLGLAYRQQPAAPSKIDSEELEKELCFVGLVGMIDPARMEVKPAMANAAGAGIRTIMITGDYPNTAKAIAEDIGLLRPGHKVLTGHDLNEMSDEQLKTEVEVTDVFARVSPEHKMRIVDALKSNDEVVAMTGDGVNDAPAIKRSDIGVAMGITGTDVAKETADMVLTDDNYASIVSAIEQGRIIYSNIRKFVYYLISCNMAEILIIFSAMLISGRSPLTAIQLLWLNLVTDGAPALALANEKGDPDIMDQAPRPAKEAIINARMRSGIVVQTIAITAATLAAYYLGLRQGQSTGETMAFVTLSASELLRAFTARSEFFPILKIGLFTNKWMNYGVAASMILILVVVYVPFLHTIFNTVSLTLQSWTIILPLLLVPAVSAEITKAVMRRRQQSAKA
jgi:P-type Ca2+ transporter type 2C